MDALIPKRAHFVWIGARLPWIYSLALRSAALRGGLDRVVLHSSDDLSGEGWWPELEALGTVELRRLDPPALLEAARGPALVDLYRKLTDARARANVLRVALLSVEGGIYLDCDTLTVASLAPLCETSAFCGLERLVFPADLRWFERPLGFGAALVRTAARDAMRRLPEGWRLFRRVERFYPLAVNNAVLGSPPHHELIDGLIDRMLAVPNHRLGVRYELGTSLLQNAVAEYRGSSLRVYPPEVFYPLGPEISEHWFRSARRAAVRDVLSPNTRVIHWYASVRTRQVVRDADAEWVRRHLGRQLWSSLAAEFLTENGLH